jgi:hypothetical protein
MKTGYQTPHLIFRIGRAMNQTMMSELMKYTIVMKSSLIPMFTSL